MLALNLSMNVPLIINIFSIVTYYLIIYLPSIISIFLLFKYSNYRIFYLTVVRKSYFANPWCESYAVSYPITVTKNSLRILLHKLLFFINRAKNKEKIKTSKHLVTLTTKPLQPGKQTREPGRSPQSKKAIFEKVWNENPPCTDPIT